MENKDTIQKVKWFIGGACLATTVMLVHRQYELTVIGMWIQNIVNNPELLEQFRRKITPIIK